MKYTKSSADPYEWIDVGSKNYERGVLLVDYGKQLVQSCHEMSHLTNLQINQPAARSMINIARAMAFLDVGHSLMRSYDSPKGFQQAPVYPCGC